MISQVFLITSSKILIAILMELIAQIVHNAENIKSYTLYLTNRKEIDYNYFVCQNIGNGLFYAVICKKRRIT